MSDLYHYKDGPPGNGGQQVSQDDSALTNPIEVVIAAGETSSAVPLWLATLVSDRYFDSITETPVDISGPDESTYIQLAPSGAGGVEGSYASPGSGLTLAGQAGPGSGTYIKHFLKVSIPSGASAEIKVDLRVQVNATERAVTT